MSYLFNLYISAQSRHSRDTLVHMKVGMKGTLMEMFGRELNHVCILVGSDKLIQFVCGYVELRVHTWIVGVKGMVRYSTGANGI